MYFVPYYWPCALRHQAQLATWEVSDNVFGGSLCIIIRERKEGKEKPSNDGAHKTCMLSLTIGPVRFVTRPSWRPWGCPTMPLAARRLEMTLAASRAMCTNNSSTMTTCSAALPITYVYVNANARLLDTHILLVFRVRRRTILDFHVPWSVYCLVSVLKRIRETSTE